MSPEVISKYKYNLKNNNRRNSNDYNNYIYIIPTTRKKMAKNSLTFLHLIALFNEIAPL